MHTIPTTIPFQFTARAKAAGTLPVCGFLSHRHPLFDIHQHISHGACFVSPDGQYRTSLSMVGFVDDSTGTCNDVRPQVEAPMNELLKMMEHDAQLWNNLLYCSGGKLELTKCSFHVLTFHFRPNGQPIPEIEEYPNQIHITDLETDARIQITSKRSFDPHKTLGHYKSPYSKPTTQLQHIKNKADRLSLLIAVSPISRQGAYLAYHTLYIPSVQYTLPQSFFNRQELEKAQATSVQKLCAKCGYNRNLARVLLFAPAAYSGGGFIPYLL